MKNNPCLVAQGCRHSYRVTWLVAQGCYEHFFDIRTGIRISPCGFFSNWLFDTSQNNIGRTYTVHTLAAEHRIFRSAHIGPYRTLPEGLRSHRQRSHARDLRRNNSDNHNFRFAHIPGRVSRIGMRATRQMQSFSSNAV